MTRLLNITVIGAALGLLVLALACGGEEEPASGTGSSGDELTLGGGSGGTAGVFRRLWQEPPTLDPHEAGDTTSAGIIVEVFSGLVALNTSLQVAPELAERWDVSEDGKTYTFHLRPNARFHDGKPVTAEDVKYSLERATDAETQSPEASAYLNDIVGVTAKLAGRADEIEGVRVIDAGTVEITINEPKPYFLAKLTYPTSYVVDRENLAAEGDDWVFKPNGTGPFKLTEYRVGALIVLERNEHYYHGPALLDRVELILSGGSAMAMYENGEIDITGVGLSELDRVSNPLEPLNAEVVVAPPGFDLAYIGFNLSEPPFDDANFRRALAHAIDKETIASRVLLELVVPATGILPPDFPGYNPAVQAPGFDPARAQELMAQSKYAGGAPRIIVTIPGTGGSAGLDLEAILNMWEETLGLRVELQQVEAATFWEDLNDRRLQAFAGLGWQADYPDPQNFLDILFHSESQLNQRGYSNPEVDRLLEAARVERDWEARKALYNEAEQLIVDDVPWVLLWFSGENIVLLKPYVKGYALTPLIVPKLKDVYIEGR
ncbi:MAG: peptide ABC transporter substrate-binding protein [Chloroflexota bacterium]|nr:peptide ABC transporter substrate-binding protein [Chloroflexota bacterium]MDE2969156.1 peptide ABC transporter substrate-binding protein [Chloroflexota bacterium]